MDGKLKRNIKVYYDGSYPSTCMGELTIVVDGIEIYKEQYCCTSTGTVWFDGDWNEHIECGKLIWNDTNKFDEDIQDAVSYELSKHSVCCGGCV